MAIARIKKNDTVICTCGNDAGKTGTVTKVDPKKGVAIKEASPTSSIKKGSVATAVIVRTGNPIRREDGSTVHFDQNACVLVDSKLNPIGTRVFGPVARELRDKNYMKILSMAPEVV